MAEVVALLDPGEEDDDERRCIVGKPNGNGELMLSIFGPDQDATEFLSREQWEKFVRNVNTMMEWKT